MASMKENSIREYMMNVDFNSDWSLNQIQEDLKKMLGEIPGIDIDYKKDVLINEREGTATEYQKVDRVKIIFTDLDDRFKKLEFIIN